MSVLKHEWGTDQSAFFPFRGNALSTPFASEEERDNWLIQKRSETDVCFRRVVGLLKEVTKLDIIITSLKLPERINKNSIGLLPFRQLYGLYVAGLIADLTR